MIFFIWPNFHFEPNFLKSLLPRVPGWAVLKRSPVSRPPPPLIEDPSAPAQNLGGHARKETYPPPPREVVGGGCRRGSCSTEIVMGSCPTEVQVSECPLPISAGVCSQLGVQCTAHAYGHACQGRCPTSRRIRMGGWRFAPPPLRISSSAGVRGFREPPLPPFPYKPVSGSSASGLCLKGADVGRALQSDQRKSSSRSGHVHSDFHSDS